MIKLTFALPVAGCDDLGRHNSDIGRPFGGAPYSITCCHGCRAASAAAAQRRYTQNGPSKVDGLTLALHALEVVLLLAMQ